ncbi:MAG: hypothetical protein II413_07290 [Treponema sp.]|nr:hypothetical protein [Treponema sp.]
MRNAKKLIVVLFVLSFCRLYAYDYPWPVDYKIKNKTLEEINKIVWDAVYENPEFHVYVLDGDGYKLSLKMDEPYKLSDGAKEWMTREGIIKDDWYYFPLSVDATVYLYDVNAAVHFFIPQFTTGKIVIRLDHYSFGYELVEDQIRPKKNCKWFSFNDVEPTKQEIPIKESFEKNFLSKLDLEWKYEKPSCLDRGLSRFLTLFRKRKAFPDD